MKTIYRFLRITHIWILLLPTVTGSLGTLSNQAVKIANHDRFPVLVNDKKLQDAQPDSEGFLDDEHIVMTSKTHLNALADIWDFNSEGTCSIGDELIDLGAWLDGFCLWIFLALVAQKLYSSA
jgi:hypothetical protein